MGVLRFRIIDMGVNDPIFIFGCTIPLKFILQLKVLYSRYEYTSQYFLGAPNTTHFLNDELQFFSSDELVVYILWISCKLVVTTLRFRVLLRM